MIEKYTSEKIHTCKIQSLNYSYFKKGIGTPVILLHGFPDNAIGWIPTMNTLEKEGYATFAPFLRGYYPTDLSPTSDYSVQSIAKDILAFADEMGLDKFYLVGHDWGASIAYTVALLAPDRIIKLTTVAIPHPRNIKPSLKVAYQVRHFILFQFHKFSLWYTKRNNYAYIDYIYKWWSPKWDAPSSFTKMMKDCYDQPGYLDAALGYYRSLGADSRDKVKAKFSRQKTSVPTQVIVGDSDGAISSAMFEGMEMCFTNSYQIDWLENAGHFPHQEEPEAFAELLINYLKAV